MRWWWIIGAALWLSIGWSTLSIAGAQRTGRRVRAAAVALTGTVSLVVGSAATSVRLPDEQYGLAVEAVGVQLTDRLDPDTPYLLEWTDRRAWGATGMGVFVYLYQHGFDVSVPRHYDMWFDSWHLRDRSTATRILTVIGSDDVTAGVQPPPVEQRVAHHDPLSARERERADRLWAHVRSELDPASEISLEALDSDTGRATLLAAGIDSQVIQELASIRARGSAYDVYLTPR
jgi:hypothetical protein